MQVREARIRKTLFTAEELFRLSSTGRRYELVRGELYEMPPAGGRHGNVAMTIGIFIGVYVRAHQLGTVFAAETGFILGLNPDTVRAPDASFVSRDRLPQGEVPSGFLEMAPDLAVEVLSPNDRSRDVREKVDDWLQAGTRLVWVIDPVARTVTVHGSLENSQRLTEEDLLGGGDVVPGFSCAVRELFA
jgi:Uma2 family endonuclease